MEIAVLGAINWDTTIFVNRFPSPGEEVEVMSKISVPGGTGANVAVASSHILGRGKIFLMGALGKDEVGERQIDILKAEGIDTSGIKRVDQESGQAYIVVDEKGENIIHSFLGANACLFPEDIQGAEKIISESKLLLITDPPLDTVRCAALLAHRLDLEVIWDPGIYVQRGWEAVAGGLKHIDYLVLNQVEMERLTKTKEVNMWKEMIATINSELRLIVKQGSRGAMLMAGDTTCSIPAVTLEDIGLRAVSTVGCGDSFMATFGAFKTLGYDDAQSVRYANLAAAIKASRRETRGSPTLEELVHFCLYLNLPIPLHQ
jgi:ribokinase